MYSAKDQRFAKALDIPGAPGASPLDRARMESDVRAFLRQRSTPWIVFAEGKGAGAPYVPQVEAALAQLEPLVHAPVSGAAALPVPMLAPASIAPTAVSVPPPVLVDEPSVRAMIRDTTPADGVRAMGPSIEIDLRSLTRGSRTRKRVAITAVAAVAVAVLATGAASIKSKNDQSSGPPRLPPTALAAEPPRAELAETTPSPVAAKDAPVVTKEAPSVPVIKAAAKAPTGLGRLIITGEARSRAVYMDGKMMLGSGPRSFNVRCGPHTLAVGNKTEPRDIEIPCNGELKITR